MGPRNITGVLCGVALALLPFPAAHAASADPTEPDIDFVVLDEVTGATATPQPRPKFVFSFGAGIHWPGGVYGWHYNPSGAPGTFANTTTTVDALKSGFAKWSAVCGVTENYLGTTTIAPDTRLNNGSSSDRTNVVGWTSLGESTAGLTHTWTSGASLIDGDIMLDPADVTSSTAMSRVVTHEIGHVLGMSHSDVEDALMSGPPLSTYNNLAAPAVDDIRGCRCMYGPKAAQTAGYFCTLPQTFSLGSANVGSSTAKSLVITNNGNGPISIASVRTDNTQFQASGCTGSLAPSALCTVTLRLAPTAAGSTQSSLRIDTGEGVPYVVALTGSGAVLPVVPVLELSTSSIDFGVVAVATTSSATSVIVSNAGSGLLTLDSLAPLAGANAIDFNRTGTCATGISLRLGETCTLAFTFTPTAVGARSASFNLATSAGARTIALAGTGTSPPVAAAIPVVEFYHAALDHYFISIGTDEIATLDAGIKIIGWKRTGKSFKAFVVGTAGTSAVCRYYIPPARGNSHYFGRGTAECKATGSANPTFVLEEPRYFGMFLPTAGVCPSATVPVYRVFSGRADANHRYTTERTVRDQMVAQGWIAEGDGSDLVVMCAPP